ncbi:hypothetical protein ACFPL7_05745 [Dongia soli]|uniref:Uncharacterized protein n=1 Tax=Dongia soli TaxID=600628 RepID=A0ABU5EGB6_9PROT|nr:hypothetical protein [Dongia soli]MDY0884904.1 hypothetical protein [Dongia soli]
MLGICSWRRLALVSVIALSYACGNVLAFALVDAWGEAVRSIADIGRILLEASSGIAPLFFLSFVAATVLGLLILPWRLMGAAFWSVLIIAAVAGSAAASFAGYLAISHNPQEIYLDTRNDGLNIPNLFPIVYSWFCAFFFPTAIFGLMVLLSCSGIDDTPPSE